jgi:hypothetical protein
VDKITKGELDMNKIRVNQGSLSQYRFRVKRFHGKRSALLIENASVGWIIDRDKIDMGEPTSTLLDEVKEQIEKEMK